MIAIDSIIIFLSFASVMLLFFSRVPVASLRNSKLITSVIQTTSSTKLMIHTFCTIGTICKLCASCAIVEFLRFSSRRAAVNLHTIHRWVSCFLTFLSSTQLTAPSASTILYRHLITVHDTVSRFTSHNFFHLKNIFHHASIRITKRPQSRLSKEQQWRCSSLHE